MRIREEVQALPWGSPAAELTEARSARCSPRPGLALTAPVGPRRGQITAGWWALVPAVRPVSPLCGGSFPPYDWPVQIPLVDGLRADGSADAVAAVRAAGSWVSGGLVGLPTETVYGLAADAQDADAVGRVYRVKGRPPSHPLIVHIYGAQALAAWCAGSNPPAQRLAEAFWPGALTVIVRRSRRAGDFLTGGQDTVALRCPNHRVALACLEALGRATGDPARGVAAPSANRFGRVSPTRATDVLDELGARMDPRRDLVVDGGPCAVGVESTIVDCTADPPRVLRLGAISQAQIDAVLAAGQPPGSHPGPPSPRARALPEFPEGAQNHGGRAQGADPGAGGGDVRPSDSNPVRVPGTLEAHYSPHARVVLVERPADAAAPPEHAGELHDSWGLSTLEEHQPARIRELAGAGQTGLIAPADLSTPPGWARLSAPATSEEFARDLYGALRRADGLGLSTVVAVLPGEDDGPLAQAVRDRLTRAAHGE